MTSTATSTAATSNAATSNKNIFERYDIVLPMTRGVIDRELVHLTDIGAIPSRILLYRTTDADGDDTYVVAESAADRPDDVARIDAVAYPGIDIVEDGTTLRFVLRFTRGTLHYYYVTGEPPEIVWADADMAGWTYALTVNMDIATVADPDSEATSDAVRQQLTDFTDADFRVGKLMLDFTSTDLLDYVPDGTAVGEAGSAALDVFAAMMKGYLTFVTADPAAHPYILGYSVTASDDSAYPEGITVPLSLEPCATTFDCKADKADPDLATLDYLLVTRHGYGKLPSGAPPRVPSKWVSASDGCDAQMIFRPEILVERLIVEPIFDQIRAVYDAIKHEVNTSRGNDYDAAKKTTGSGFHFVISDDKSGKNEYVNEFYVDFKNEGDTAKIVFRDGYIKVFKKKVKKNACFGVEDAKVDCTYKMKWSGTVALSASKKDGVPIIEISEDFEYSDDQHTNKNDCAKSLDAIADFVGDMTGMFTDIASQIGLDIDVGALLDQAIGVAYPQIGSLGAMVSGLNRTVATSIILPGGGTYFFKAPRLDADGTLTLLLTYKSAT
ncbi:MAG: hypothetical protein RID91_19200 [Azospirillaceae bacterium]